MKTILLIFIFLVGTYSAKAQYLYDRIEKKYEPKLLLDDIEKIRKDLKKYHQALYAYANEEKLNFKFDSLKSSITQPETARALYLSLKPILSAIGDGHLRYSLFDPNKITTEDIKKYALKYESPFNQVELKFIRDKIYILNKNVEGAEVLSINHIPSTEIITSSLNYLFSDGYNTTFKYFLLNQQIPDDIYKVVFQSCKAIKVTYKLNGNRDSLVVTGKPFEIAKSEAVNITETGSSPKTESKFIDFKHIDKNTVYLKIKTFDKIDPSDVNHFNKLFEDSILNCKSLILDLRNNTGGDITLANHVIKCLIEKAVQPIEFPKEFIKGVILPSLDSVKRKQLNYVKWYNKQNGNLFPFTNSYGGRIIVLINGGTYSAAALLAYALTLNKRAVLIGEETGGGRNLFTAGDYYSNALKNSKISYQIGLVPFNATMKATETGHGVRPDIEVDYTITDYINKTDKALTLALKNLN